jgi:hypothetical protein
LGKAETRSIQQPPESHIPAVGKIPEDRLKVTPTIRSEQIRHVFKDQPSGFDLTDDAQCFKPEAAARPLETFTLRAVSGPGEIGAGETSRDAIDVAELRAGDISDVAKSSRIGEMFFEDEPVRRIDLDLPFRFPASALEAEIETANARE